MLTWADAFKLGIAKALAPYAIIFGVLLVLWLLGRCIFVLCRAELWLLAKWRKLWHRSDHDGESSSR